MRIQVLREHNDIVEVDKAYLEVQSGQDQVHHAREGCWRIAHTERKNAKLIAPSSSDKGSLRSVLRVYRQLMIACSEVKCAEPFRSSERVQALADQWERIGVFFCSGIDRAVVYAKTRGTVLLGDDHYIAGPLPGRWFDKLLVEHQLYLFVNHRQ